ncbi:MAG: fibronectin type III domain-containing protein [Prevotellaceae bacterium]|nr:fibronectin type III domain-containing protein [Prevotellaceae bacterium]
MWPHAYTLAGWGLSYTTDDGVRIGRYTCSNEVNGLISSRDVPCGIGTFVHEFGHILGLADHYATDYSEAQYVDPGTWDTMASGSYNNNSNTPPAFSAFERAELGWLDYTDLDVTVDSFVTVPELQASNMAYRITNPDDSNEYFILENRQQTGWDAYLPGHGMLVWHVDMDRTAWYGNTVNNDADHQRLDIVEADRTTGSNSYPGDPFPGTSNVTTFEFNTWDDVKLFGFSSVVESDGEIRFLTDESTIEISTPSSLTVSDVADSSFVATWGAVDIATQYYVTVSAVNSEGTRTAVNGYNDLVVTDTNLTVENLEPDTQYEIAVAAAIGNVRSETVVAEVQTNQVEFVKRRPRNIVIDEITTNSFTASWDAVDDAEGYIVNLTRQGISETTAENGYDFSDRASGMPELWETNNPTWVSVIGNYGKSAPAVRFSADGDYLRVAYPDVKITGIQFWCKASGSNAGTVYIETCNDETWEVADSFVPETSSSTKSFTFSACDSVRIRFARTNYNFTIDDVVATCNAILYESVNGYENLSVGNILSYTFYGLTENGIYGFTVQGTNAEGETLQSERILVDMSDSNASGINNVIVEDSIEAVYDLSGRKMTSDELPRGIYIIKKGRKTVKAIMK